MAADFYTEWLEVPAGPRPPDYYALLGVNVFCCDLDVIEQAARRQLTRLDEFALYPDRDTRDAVQDMMNEVARARVDLVNPKRRLAYDQKLARQLGLAVPAEPAPAVNGETLIAPATVSKESVFDEPDGVFSDWVFWAASPVEDTPLGVIEGQPIVDKVVDVAVQFEKTVWAHLQKWQLNAHEQRLLMAEADALGVAADEALGIIERIDGEVEILAEKKHKRQINLILGLAAAAVVAVITGVILSVVISERSSRERDFLAAIEAARKCLDEGDLNQAASECAKAEVIFPDDPMLEEVSKEVRLKHKAMEKAFTGALSRVRSLTDRGDLDQAASELARARAIFPGDPRVKKTANEVALKRKFTGMLSRARFLMERGELDQAASELAKAKAIFPGDPGVKEVAIDVAEAYCRMGRASAISKKYILAIAAYKRVIAIKPDYAEAYSSLGLAHYHLKQHAESLTAYKKAIAIKPDYANAYHNMGIAYYYLKRYADAITAYKNAIAIKPDYAGAYCNMGIAYGDSEQFADAITAYKIAIAIKPDYANAYHNMGIAYGDIEQHADAITAYKKAIALKPDDAEAYCSMGAAYDDLKRYTDALAAYNKAIALQPDDAEAYYLTGNAYFNLKRYTDAIAAYKKAVTLKPDDPESYNNMGCSYMELGRYSEALAAVKKAIALKPDGRLAATIYSSLGEVYQKLGERGRGIAAYEKSLALEPTGKTADLARQAIRSKSGLGYVVSEGVIIISTNSDLGKPNLLVNPAAKAKKKSEKEALARQNAVLVRQLDTRVSKLDFEDMELSQVFQFLRDVSGANIHVKWRPLAWENIKPTDTVNVHLTNVPFRKVFEAVLENVSTGGK